MNKNVKIWLALAMLVAAALLATLWATIFMPIPPFRPRSELRPSGTIHGDIELYYTVKTVISTINITLLIILLILYIGMYTKTKSEFTIGLIIFSMVLLLNALTSNPMVDWIFGFRAFGLGPFAMLPDLFTCIALAILLYFTVQY
jgi:hypothetical protein